MLVNLIKQIDKQCAGMNYKIAVMDDASKDYRYNNLGIEFQSVIYNSNPTNFGKGRFVETINKLFVMSKNNPAKKYVFLADDLALSKNFVPYIDDLFQKGHKIINFFLFKDTIYTNWGYTNWVDGAFAISHEALSKVNQPLIGQKVKVVPSSGVWRDFSRKLEQENLDVYFPKYSFVDHLGHTVSTMHPKRRTEVPVFITNFIDDNKEWDIYRKQLPPPPRTLKEKKRREKALKIEQQRQRTLEKAKATKKATPATPKKRKTPKHITVETNSTNKAFISEVQRLKNKKSIVNRRSNPRR